MRIHLSTAWRIFITVVLALGMAGLLSHSARAVGTTWIVNTLDGNTYSSCNASRCTFADAVNLSSSGDIIAFDPALSGTITLLSTIYPTHSLTIHGSPKITISGGNTRQVFNLQSSMTLNLDALTIINGNAKIFGNYGGVIYICSTCTVNISASTLSGNTANLGGAIYNEGTLTLTDSLLQDNHVTGGAGAGGAIFNYGGGLTITHSTLKGNSSEQNPGGGINVQGGTVTVTDSTFDSNSAPGGGGMEIYNATVKVNTSTFTGNTAEYSGGAIEMVGGTVNITNSTFSANSAPGGGGIYSFGTLNLVNSTFSDNIASSDIAGGLGGSDIFNDGTLNFTNTILANPISSDPGTTVDCTDDSGYGTIGTNTNNLVEDGSCKSSTGTVIGFLSGDPNLASLADYGGPTWTMALLSGSSAIDYGDADTCAADLVNGKDQRGITRPQGSVCDIGAYEFGTTLPGAFNKTAPADAAVAVSLTPTLSWGTSTNAAFYEYCYAPTTGCTNWISAGANTSAGLSNLAYDQTYYWQARAVNSNGPVAADSGSYWSFTTGSPPSATTVPASPITPSGATLNGKVNAHSSSTTVTFEYGIDTSYGATVTADQSPVTGSSEVDVSKAITGLSPNTDYHFRLAATNAFGTTYGADMTFTSACVSPVSVTSNADNGAGTLRQAIQDVCPSGTITFDAGLSAGTITLTTASPKGTHALEIPRDMTIDGSMLATPVTISGNDALGIFYVDPFVTATLKGLTLVHGSTTDGGAIYADLPSTLTVTNSTFEHNTVSASGGAIYTKDILTVTNSTLKNNTATNSGGAIANAEGNTTVTDCTLQENDAAAGGGIYSYGYLTVTRTLLKLNTATSGGGIVGVNARLTVLESTFDSNHADSYGGGIFSGYYDATVTNTTLVNNSSGQSGGGIHVNASSSLTLTNSTLTANTAASYGGAIHNDASLTVVNSTLAGNSAGSGANIYTSAGNSTLVSNTIIGSPAIGSCSGTGTITDGTHNLDAGNSCGISSLINTDPLLGPLANNGGPTQTMALLPGSPAIDAADNSVCPAKDQRGVARPLGLYCEIGAYEVNTLYAIPLGWTTGLCDSWANACELRYALTSSVSGQEIWAKAGTYKPTSTADRFYTFQLKNGVALYGGFAGTETARGQRNPAANLTILSGDLNGDDVGFTNNGENVYQVVTGASGAILDGFTISGGNANVSYCPGTACGGGMYNHSGSSPVLTDVTFSGNTASWYGAGMYNDSSSSPKLTRVTFSGNKATLNGGGMYNESSSSPELMDVTFSGNTAGQYGGGMYNSTNSSPTLTDVTFEGNKATSYYGGGMYNFSSSSPQLTNVTFSGNTAGGYGGGMENNTNSSPKLTGVTFSGNTAGSNFGGGMSNRYSSNPELTNVTFSGNTATNAGGMYNYSSSPQLTNVTFSGNSATVGYVDGMFNQQSSNPTIRNTIFWGNPALDHAQIDHDLSSSPSVSDSVVRDGYPDGTNIITTDPLLGTLGNYGGHTQTIPLLPGSSAIDTGNDTLCAAAVGSPAYGAGGLDQRGVARPQGAACDIGAYEAQLVSLPLVTGWNLVSFNLHPLDTTIASVLASLGDQYSLVYAWDAAASAWHIYDPSLGSLNDLEDLDESLGFWIKMKSNQNLTVSGRVIANPSIDLVSGWNLVGYPSAVTGSLPEVFGNHGLGIDFSLVYAYHAVDESAAWKLFDRLGNPLLNDLTELSPGWGYWIKAGADHTWNVP